LVTRPEGVLFDFDSAAFKPDASGVLDRVAEVIVLAEGRRASIRGHTDSRGADAYNQDLSNRRALAVRDYLVQRHDIDAARLEAVGLGETQPSLPNENPDGSDNPGGREANRRVEVVLFE
jgi:OmpA-OmpF porin, OOP family